MRNCTNRHNFLRNIYCASAKLIDNNIIAKILFVFNVRQEVFMNQIYIIGSKLNDFISRTFANIKLIN